MTISRRSMFGGAAGLAGAAAGAVSPARASAQGGAVSLPDKVNFRIDHVFLDSAYVHPMGQMTYDAVEAFLRRRRDAVDTRWPADNPRDAAVAGFAALMGVNAADIAVVPSTQVGENLVVQALDLTGEAGVVTDAFHYSPEIYGELQHRGVAVAVVRPRDGRIDLADIDRAIGPNVRLVAVSAISSDTGFRHDLAALCDIAHRKGSLVYADIIQAAGAVPLDLKALGVDFACCGGYKWLMGDFGAAFLYVRPDRLARLKRPQAGWRQFKTYQSHTYPFDPPGERAVDFTLREDAVGLFETSTPAWGALAGLVGGMDYIHALGVERIAAHRRPLIERLYERLLGLGFAPQTPLAMQSPSAAFAFQGAAARLKPALLAARVQISVYPNRIRVSPSVFNDRADIDHLADVITRAI